MILHTNMILVLLRAVGTGTGMWRSTLDVAAMKSC